MRSCDRNAKDFARSLLSLTVVCHSGWTAPGLYHCSHPSDESNLPPTASSKSTLNYQAGHKRNWIGLGLDRRKDALETLKRVSRWQRDKRENEKGGRMGGGNALKCQGAAAMHLCQCGIHQAQLSPRKRGGGNSRMTSSTKSQLLVMLNSFKQILQSETLS